MKLGDVKLANRRNDYKPSIKKKKLSEVPVGSVDWYILQMDKCYVESMQAELPDLDKRERKLRMSGFPFCGLKNAYYNMNPHLEVEQRDANMWFYTSFGTRSHEVFQRYVGMSGAIYGDWKCRNPKCDGERKKCVYRKCPKCKGEMEYVEFEVELFDNMSGHVDGVWEAPDGTLWVIDYKTTSVSAIANHWRNKASGGTGLFPYAKNEAQIKGYAASLGVTHGLNIKGWMLLYLARDRPIKERCIVAGIVTEQEKRDYFEKMRAWDKQYELGKPENLSKKSILRLVEEKPCNSFKFYTENYKEFDTDCPLAGVCFNRRELLEELQDSYIKWKDQKS